MPFANLQARAQRPLIGWDWCLAVLLVAACAVEVALNMEAWANGVEVEEQLHGLAHVTSLFVGLPK